MTPCGILNIDSTEKLTVGITTAVVGGLSLSLPVLILTMIGFIAIDFVVGIWASYVRAKRKGELDLWGFESAKMWNTVFKLVLSAAGVVMLEVLDVHVMQTLPVVTGPLCLANFFTAFVCGVELFSFLENAAEISNHPAFRWARKFMGGKLADNGVDIDKHKEEDNGECE